MASVSNSSNNLPFDFSEVVKDPSKWEKIGDVEKMLQEHPLGEGNSNFDYGVATCTYQDSGSVNCPDSQWVDWEKHCLPPENRSGESANLFQKYKTKEGRQDIIERLHRLGVNTYRFSIEWSQIEPKQGEFNLKNLKVYVALCKHLRDEGIKPMITFHHFSEPKWFHQLGSFEKEENIQYFNSFCQKVFPSLIQNYNGKPLVERFCTINEPNIEAFSRYVLGSFSPGCHGNFNRAGHFLMVAYKAHSAVYKSLKEIAKTNKADVQIGIIHQYLRFISANFLFSPITSNFNKITNDVALNFFKTGNFKLHVPFLCNIDEQMEIPKTDFVGVQVYTRPVIGFTGSTTKDNTEKMTTMPMRDDPASVYEAIIECHKAFGAPVEITENGISTTDDAQRARYMTRAMLAAREAVKVIGKENFLGYIAWCLGDNFEWNMGMSPQRFGLFQVLEGVMFAEPKQGIKDSYVKAIQAWRRSLTKTEV